MITPEEYKGVMDFCQFCRGRINREQLSAAWEEYSDMVLNSWNMKIGSSNIHQANN